MVRIRYLNSSSWLLGAPDEPLSLTQPTFPGLSPVFLLTPLPSSSSAQVARRALHFTGLPRAFSLCGSGYAHSVCLEGLPTLPLLPDSVRTWLRCHCLRAAGLRSYSGRFLFPLPPGHLAGGALSAVPALIPWCCLWPPGRPRGP